uniref:40S ribosomal protein S3a n=1 Tax=Panthera leo TaxID=9689 RepID=A0A8C8XGQ5_PANLE
MRVLRSNKQLRKGSKKGPGKKVVDPFSKKDWYDVKVPTMFNIRNVGKILVTRTQGTKIASDSLKGHVFEVSLADLQNDEVAFRKFKLIAENVHGKNCLISMAWILPVTKCAPWSKTGRKTKAIVTRAIAVFKNSLLKGYWGGSVG